MAITSSVQAGDGYHMKCETNACGFESQVTFGGGMFFQQITGYCKKCNKFVYLSWTRENIPESMKGSIKVRPRPVPLGEIWDGKTGKSITIYSCPTCKGPFMEIKNPAELAHCPACNKPGFAVDTSKPRMAID